MRRGDRQRLAKEEEESEKKRRRADGERQAQRTGLKMRARAAILFASTFLVFFFSEARMDEMSAAACSTLACRTVSKSEGGAGPKHVLAATQDTDLHPPLHAGRSFCILPSIAWQRSPSLLHPSAPPSALSSTQIGLFGQLGLAELQQALARGHAGLGHALGKHAQAQLTDSAFAFNTLKSMGRYRT